MNKLFRLAGFLPFVLVLFLNAAVDSGHKIIIQNTVFKMYDGNEQIVLTAIVNALILLPFIMLFTPAGFISDKYPKDQIIRAAAWTAVGLTSLITLCYYLGWFWPAFAMTFLLAVQSAIYSPSKYGYIKELTGNTLLTQANGVVQAATTTAILSGIFIFSVLFERYLVGSNFQTKAELLQAIAPIGWLLIIGSLIEVMCAYRLKQKQSTDHSMQFDWQRYRRGDYLKSNFSSVRKQTTIWLSIVGLAIFWAISQVILAAFPAFAKETLGVTNTVTIQGMLACAGLGVMLGSLIAGRASRTYIETGLIPIGAVGVAITLMLVPVLEHARWHALNFFALGTLGGVFIIPLNALIQFHAAEQERGRVLAANNLVGNMTMLGFLVLTVVFSLAGISTVQLFLLLIVVAVCGALYTIYRLPQSLVRYMVLRLLGSKYRLEVVGFDNLPESGGVLLLGNHISWIDWAIIQMASPRPVRFVMARNIYERWYLKWFLDFFGVIPIGGAASKTALETITRLINEGEVVCLFPEGTISRTGHLAEFQRGYEKSAAGATGIILPFYMRGLWGSRFSRSSERLQNSRKAGNKRDIIFAFGEPLPMTTQADELKRRIFDLSVHSWDRYTAALPPLPYAWLATAKRYGNNMAATDFIGEPISHHRFATATICFSRLIRRHTRGQNLGLLLPTSTAGAIANMAALMRGKTVVNLNYTASKEAIAGALESAEIETVLTSRKFLQKLEGRNIELLPMMGKVDVVYMEDLAEQISAASKLFTLGVIKALPTVVLQRLYCKRIRIEQPAAILFSSGSEGTPKGVVLSHRNIMGNLKQISDVLNTEDNDVIMATLPLFHAFGLTVTTFMPLVEGIPVVCHPDPTDAPNVGKAIAKYQATILCGTSTFLRLYAKNKRVHPLMLESLRIVVAGAEKLSSDVRDAFKLRFKKEVYEGYGATETTPVASVNIPDQLETQFWRVQAGNKPGTVGMPLPGSSFRIVDPATLEELPLGEDGLILIGGTQIMLGYLNNPEKTAEVITEIDGLRWYKTGDKGHLDEDGFLTIVDRYSRFAKLAGEMVSLTAVEDQVRDVLADPELQIVAVNLPDAKKGEKIVLLAAIEIDAEATKKSLLEAKCNPLMIPSEFCQVDAVPILGSGKTDFSAAKKLALEQAG